MTTIRPTKAQCKELNDWHVGGGVLMLHSAPNEVVTIEVFTGRDGVLRRIANGKPVLPITCRDDDGEFEVKRAHGETAVEELLAEHQRGLVDNPPSMFSPAWPEWVASVAGASVVEQRILDWLLEHVPAHLLREAAAALSPVGDFEEMEGGNEYSTRNTVDKEGRRSPAPVVGTRTG